MFNFQHAMRRITEERDKNMKGYLKVRKVPKIRTVMTSVGYCKRACGD